jgi:hypothetical protein
VKIRTEFQNYGILKVCGIEQSEEFLLLPKIGKEFQNCRIKQITELQIFEDIKVYGN